MFGRKKPFRAVFTCISPILYNISYIIYHTYFKPRARGEKKNRSNPSITKCHFLADFCLHAACICLSLLRQFMQTTWIFSGPLTNLQLSIPLPYSTSIVQHQHLTSVSQLAMATTSQSIQLAAISSYPREHLGDGQCRWAAALAHLQGSRAGRRHRSRAQGQVAVHHRDRDAQGPSCGRAPQRALPPGSGLYSATHPASPSYPSSEPPVTSMAG